LFYLDDFQIVKSQKITNNNSHLYAIILYIPLINYKSKYFSCLAVGIKKGGLKN
jgi:hypothetical protein